MVDGWERDENVALFPFPTRGTIPPPPHFRHVRKSFSYFVSNDLNYGRSKKKKGESGWGSVSVRWLAPPPHLPFSPSRRNYGRGRGYGRMTNKCCHISLLPSSPQLSRNGFLPPPLLRRPKVSISFFLEKGLPGVGVEIEPYLSTCLTEKDLYHYIFFPCQLEIELVKSNA